MAKSKNKQKNKTKKKKAISLSSAGSKLQTYASEMFHAQRKAVKLKEKQENPKGSMPFTCKGEKNSMTQSFSLLKSGI